MNPDLSTYPAVKAFLYSLKHHGAKYGIDRMRLLAERLGNPQDLFPCIHIAGTNGKGSVSAMLEAVYRENGFRTGMYTSPHLVRQGERIQVERRIMKEERIAELTRVLYPQARCLAEANPEDHPSFFEFMTAMAFMEFAEEEVDLGIIETGLGGRLDATNIVRPILSVITSISYDHVDILGDTLGKIASEKAGIIKPGVPVVMGLVPEEAESVIRETARDRGAPLYSVRERFSGIDYPETNLEGAFQRHNAATATLSAEVLRSRFPVDEALRNEALKRVSWPGRWQRIEAPEGLLILDATHNPEGCEALEDNFRKLVEATGEKPDVAVGTLGSYRVRPLMQAVTKYARNLHLLQPRQPRAADYEALSREIPDTFSGRVVPTSIPELFPVQGLCKWKGEAATLVVTGSIYLVGEVADRLFHETPVEDSFLQDPIR